MATLLDAPAHSQTRRRTPFDPRRMTLGPDPEESPKEEETPSIVPPAPALPEPRAGVPEVPTPVAPGSSAGGTAARLVAQRLAASQPLIDEKARKSMRQSPADYYKGSSLTPESDWRAMFPGNLPRPRPEMGGVRASTGPEVAAFQASAPQARTFRSRGAVTGRQMVNLAPGQTAHATFGAANATPRSPLIADETGDRTAQFAGAFPRPRPPMARQQAVLPAARREPFRI